MEYAIYALYAIVAGLAIYAATSMKSPKTKPASIDEFNVPLAEEGREYAVLYGTDWFVDQNVVWYGDLGVETETEDHVKTRKYSLGIHMEFFQGMPDKLLELKADDRTYWNTPVTSSQRITINEGSLFGGKRDRGGIVGDIDVMFGEETQAVNDYLLDVIGAPLSAMRGVAGLVFRHVYVVANSPYVAPHSARWSRIFNGWENDVCWYPEKASIDCNCGEPAPGWRVILLANFDDEGLGQYPLDESQDGRLFGPQGLSLPVVVTDDTKFGAGSYYSNGVPDNMTVIVSWNGVGIDLGEAATFPGAFTMEGHAQADSLGALMCAFGFFDATTLLGKALFIRVNASGYPEVAVMENTVTSILATSPDLITVGPWVEYALTRDDDDICYFFVDGDLKATFSYAGEIKGDLGRLVVLGQRNNLSRYNIWDGRVDSVRFTKDLCRYTESYTPHTEAFEDDSVAAEACEDPDMNPAHVFYDLITNSLHGMGRPTADIDDDNFRDAADTFYNECFGITTKFNRQGPIAEFMKSIEEVTDSVVDIDPITGLWYCTPIRDDYDPDTLPIFDTETNAVRIEEFSAHGYGNIVTRLLVNYKDPDTAKPAQTPPWDNPATWGAQGRRLIIEEFEAPQIRQHSLAQRVCAREGMKKTHELRAFTVIANQEGYGQRRGSVIKVSDAKLGLDEVICRVIAVNYGNLKNREIKMGVIEDVFGLPDSTYTQVQTSQWVEPDFSAQQVDPATVMELPRWYLKQALGEANTAALDLDAGYGQAMGVQPTGLSTGFDLWHQKNSGGYSEEKTDADWTRVVTLADSIAGGDEIAYIDDASEFNIAAAGDLVQIGEGADAEIIRLTSVDLSASDPSISFTRGHLDTTPKQLWPQGTRLWLLPESGEFEDDDEYTAGDVVDYKLLTTTGQDQLDIDDATAESLTMSSRAARPIAPGNVLINGEPWPEYVELTCTVTVEDRNRVTHSDLTLQTATGITGEDDVLYNYVAYNADDDSVIDSELATAATTWIADIPIDCNVRIEIESVRGGSDGYVSWQKQIREFAFTTTELLLWADGELLLWADGEIVQE